MSGGTEDPNSTLWESPGDDRPSNVETDRLFLESCRFYLQGVSLASIAILGIVGNGLSIVVLTRPQMRSSFNNLLTGLATFDFVYLLLSLFLFGLPELSQDFTKQVLPLIMPIGYGFVHIGRVGSVLMTLSVTVERFFAIVHPLRRVSLTTFLFLSSVVGSIVYNIPRFFELRRFHVNVTNDVNQTETIHQIGPTELRMNRIYIQIYIVWMKFIIVELVPYITILVLNAIMIVRIRRALAEQKTMTARTVSAEVQKRELNMAIMLVCIVVMFILCQSVKIVPDMYEALLCNHTQGEACDTTTLIELLISVSHVLLAINSASNFVIYMWRGDKFRRVFRKTIRRWLCMPEDQTRTTREGTRYRYSTKRFSKHENIPLTRMTSVNDHEIGMSTRKKSTIANGTSNS